MGVVLPNELVWVPGAIGVTWPNIDEDGLHHAGDEFRKLSANLSAHKSGAMGEIKQMLHVDDLLCFGRSLPGEQYAFDLITGDIVMLEPESGYRPRQLHRRRHGRGPAPPGPRRPTSPRRGRAPLGRRGQRAALDAAYKRVSPLSPNSGINMIGRVSESLARR